MSTADAVRRLLEEIVVASGATDRSAALTSDPVRAAEIIASLGCVADVPKRRVEWAVVNGERVDAAILAPEREWRVVCSIDPGGVQGATVFERPSRFDGIPGGQAVIVDGPSSAGKSSVMAAVVGRAHTPWVMFDDLGFGTTKMPFLIWPEAAPTLQSGFVAGITAFAAAGNQVITTARGRPPEHFASLVATVPTLTVRLDCPLEVRMSRQARRGDRWGGLTELSEDPQVAWAYSVRYDTSEVELITIADDILRRTTR